MRAILRIYCEADGHLLGEVVVDTADDSDERKARVDRIIEGHRDQCPYYGDRLVGSPDGGDE